MIRLLLPFNLCLLLLHCGRALAQTSEVEFCQFEIEASLKRANASFGLVYEFELAPAGRPTKVRKVLDKWVGEPAVAACIAGWRFPDLPAGTKLTVLQRWKHGRGWELLQITGENFTQKVTLGGSLCPYPPSTASPPESMPRTPGY